MKRHSAKIKYGVRECSGIAMDEGASDTLVVINDLKEALALLAVKVDLTNFKVFIHQNARGSTTHIKAKFILHDTHFNGVATK